jgi:hypothetical protein
MGIIGMDAADSRRGHEHGLGSTIVEPPRHRVLIAQVSNLAANRLDFAISAFGRQWVDTVCRRRPPSIVVLDMDSSASPTYGERGERAQGYFGCTCYHPLFVFDQLGDLERRAVRPGNMHSPATGMGYWSRSCRAIGT